MKRAEQRVQIDPEERPLLLFASQNTIERVQPLVRASLDRMGLRLFMETYPDEGQRYDTDRDGELTQSLPAYLRYTVGRGIAAGIILDGTVGRPDALGTHLEQLARAAGAAGTATASIVDRTSVSARTTRCNKHPLYVPELVVTMPTPEQSTGDAPWEGQRAMDSWLEMVAEDASMGSIATAETE